MDKLKPIIEQKFWIFLGLALLLPFIGWFLATSSYATGVDERETAIKGAFDSVNISGDPPNTLWVNGADEIVKNEQQRFQAAQQELWRSQQQSMDWPSGVQSLMDQVPYEDEIPARAREFYSQGYFRQLEQVEQRLRPFDYETGEGVLLFDGYETGGAYTHVPVGQWNVQAPTSQEMWEAQIDTWLVRAVFDSIESINAGAEKITEAPVRQLLELTLRGGERNFTTSSTATGGSEATGEDDMTGGMYDLGGDSFSGDSGGTGSSSVQASVRFDLSEELGPTSSGNSGGQFLESFDSFENADSGGDSDSAAPKGSGRYVDDDENSPFRTRAFVLGVVMDHKKLPEFLAELSRSDWPIQIIRVQTAAYNPEELATVGRAGGRSGRRPTGGSFGPGLGAFSSGGGGDDAGMFSDNAGTFGSSSSGSTTGRSSRPRVPGTSSGTGARNAAGLEQQAMSDPYLFEVWIGGLITLFRPVEAEEIADAQNTLSPGENLGADPTEAVPNKPQDNSSPGTLQETTVPSGDSNPSEASTTETPLPEPTTPVPADPDGTESSETSPGTDTPKNDS